MPKVLLIALITLLVLLALPWLLPRPGLNGTIPDQPFADSRFGEINGVGLHWRQRLVEAPIERPLIVLVHGFGGSAFTWRHTLDRLEQAGYPAIAVDLPPFGYSERTGRGAAWADLVFGLVRKVAPDRELIVVGHSMGAGVAADMAAAAPDQVRQIMLVDGTPGLRRASGGAVGWALAIPSVRRAAESWAAWKLVNDDNIGRMLSSAFGREPTAEERAGYFAPLTIPGTYPPLLQRMNQRRGNAPEGWDRVALVVIWGEHDDWVNIDRIRPWIADHPNLRAFDIIEGAGHNPMDTHPEAFNSLLLERIAGDM